MAGKVRSKPAKDSKTPTQSQPAAGCGTLPRRATSVAVAIAVVAGAVFARTWPETVARGPGGSAFDALRAGACDFGSPDSPGTVQALEISQLSGLQLPAGLRCPVVIRGLAEAEVWRELGRWADLKALERQTPSSVGFDASTDGEFAYWDNNSLLSETVRRVGAIRQGYTKVRAPRRAFFEALAQGPGSALGSVRFGGSLPTFSRDVARSLGPRTLELTPGGQAASPPSLWLSAAGSFSTAHYDSFHNVFIMLGGEKQMLLSPPVDAHRFHIYPGTHPLARQARKHFGRLGTPRQSDLPAATRVLSTNVRGGEALFIPAGWVHHVTAVSSSTSLALTALPPEHDTFNSWMVEGSAAVLPFLATGGEWTTKRTVAALRVFTPALLKAVDFGASWSQDPLDIFANVSYGLQTRKELGLPAELPAFRPCSRPSKTDKQAAEAAAAQVARRFNTFQEELRGLYIIPYLETALSKVAGAVRDIAKIMQITTSFVQTCLLA